MRDVRSLAPLWPLRQRRHVVVVCRDDPAEYEDARDRVARLGGELVVERTPGPLSAALGRPAVVVADRFGSVALHAARPSIENVLSELESLELACPECGPQAWGDPGA